MTEKTFYKSITVGNGWNVIVMYEGTIIFMPVVVFALKLNGDVIPFIKLGMEKAIDATDVDNYIGFTEASYEEELSDLERGQVIKKVTQKSQP